MALMALVSCEILDGFTSSENIQLRHSEVIRKNLCFSETFTTYEAFLSLCSCLYICSGGLLEHHQSWSKYCSH